MEGHEFKVVFCATSPAEAEVVRAVLESADIKTLVPGSNIPFPGVALAPFSESESDVPGCEVWVAEGDFDRARAAIDEARAHPVDEGFDPPAEDPGSEPS